MLIISYICPKFLTRQSSQAEGNNHVGLCCVYPHADSLQNTILSQGKIFVATWIGTPPQRCSPRVTRLLCVTQYGSIYVEFPNSWKLLQERGFHLELSVSVLCRT